MLLPGVLLTDEIHFHRWYPDTYQPKSAGFYDAYVVLPIRLSSCGIITSIGLVRLQEWARQVTLCFPAVPLLTCALWLVLHHPRGVGDALLVIGDPTNAFATILLVIVAPISLWWWILFTRKNVRSQFRER